MYMYKKHRLIIPLYFCFLLILSACVTSSNQPDWVRDPYRIYDRQTYVAAVGSGIDRQAAEKNALGNLVAFFGQSIQVDDVVYVSYQEVINSGAAAKWSENTFVDSSIITSAGMDFLIGAEIGEVWFDRNRTYYAIAVINKRNANLIYSRMFTANQVMINNLINMPSEQRLTIEGFSRFNLAAAIADINVSYANILSLLGNPAYQHGVIKGDEYRLEAQNISRLIPIEIRVKDDNSGRIQSAFAKVLSDIGFMIGGNNSRYLLDVNITVAPENNPNNQFIFARLLLNANLIDTTDNTNLLPYSFNIRDGHNTQDGAVNRIFISAERKITEEYKDLFSSRILPTR